MRIAEPVDERFDPFNAPATSGSNSVDNGATDAAWTTRFVPAPIVSTDPSVDPNSLTVPETTTASAVRPKPLEPVSRVIDPEVAAAISAGTETTGAANQPKMIVPIADAIDPAIAAAIVALQSRSGSNPLAVFDIPGDSESIDQISRFGVPMRPVLSQLPLTVSINETWPNEGGNVVTTYAAVASEVAVSDMGPLNLGAASVDSAKRLALLRQDIAAFGGGMGLDHLAWGRDHPIYAPALA